tara:strand:- start:32311 stop:32547 length:237 start_codon:yes stop_codon:yes gene_type:complete
MTRRTKRKKNRRPETSSQKRLTTAQRWKWCILFVLAYGALLTPYIADVIKYPNVAGAIVLTVIAGGGIFVFVVALKHH